MRCGVMQLPIPNFARVSARSARRAAISLVVASGLLVDVFAGFGGGSIASERAHGRPVNIAINHWPVAIQYHERNHPLPTKHFTADVREIDPLDATEGMPVLHAHFSPDCRHFSSAKGGQPVSDGVRALPWVVVRWAESVRPALITMENVKEFVGWGPTRSHQVNGEDQFWPSGEMKRIPVKEQAGSTFKEWVNRLRELGYKVDWKILDAAAWGAPTHRKRLFLVARCDGEEVVWPKPTHGPENSDLLPYRTAAECIDFSRPCPSIFMDRADAQMFKSQTGIQCQRPLKPKTLWRIANGVKRYVIDTAKPFIVRSAHGDGAGESKRWGRSSQAVSEPLPTVTASKDFAVVDPTVSPVLVGPGGREGQSDPRPLTRPLSTITAKNDKGIVAATLQKYYGQGIGQSIAEPMHTVTTKDRIGLIAANMVNVQHGGTDPRAASVSQPLNTITGKHGNGLLASNLIKFRGDSDGRPVTDPMPTITAGGQAGGRDAGAAHAMGVSSAVLVEVQNSSHAAGSRPVDVPVPTVTANPKGGGWAMAAAFLAKLRGSGGWKPIDAPLDVICAGAPTFAHVAAVLVKFYGTSKAADIMKPLATITAGAGGGHLGLIHATLAPCVDEASLAGFWRVYAFLVQHLGSDAPLPLVEADGQLYLIIDLGMRMLEPRELLNAQFTPEIAKDYILPENKAMAVRLIGNSVSPPVLEAVIRAQGMMLKRKKKVA